MRTRSAGSTAGPAPRSRRRSRDARRRARRCRARGTCATRRPAGTEDRRARALPRRRRRRRRAARGRCPARRTARPSPRAHRNRATRAADPGIDDRKVHADRQVRERVTQHDRALQHRLRLDAVRHVDHAHVGRDARHHAVARPDEVVLQPEVGQERDRAHVRPESITSRTAATRPSRSCVAASAATSSPTDRATRVVSGPIVTARRPPADPGVRARRRAGRESRRHRLPAAPAAGAACGRAARSRPRAPRSAAGARLPPPRTAPGRRAAGTPAAARPATTRPARTPARGRARAASPPCPGPTAAMRGRLRPRRTISSAPFGLVTISQS